MKCFYHADADGKCAGFWVALNVGINDNYVPEMHEINYNIPFPMNLILPIKKKIVKIRENNTSYYEK